MASPVHSCMETRNPSCESGPILSYSGPRRRFASVAAQIDLHPVSRANQIALLMTVLAATIVIAGTLAFDAADGYRLRSFWGTVGSGTLAAGFLAASVYGSGRLVRVLRWREAEVLLLLTPTVLLARDL